MGSDFFIFFFIIKSFKILFIFTVTKKNVILGYFIIVSVDVGVMVMAGGGCLILGDGFFSVKHAKICTKNRNKLNIFF